MIDANSQFFATLTNVGMAKQANADALGIPWKITEMGVGDANNTDPIPSAAQTKLINEWRRRPLNQLRVDPINPAVLIAEQIIPADEGGRWIREIALYDADGDMVAVANCAPSFKPVLSQGSGRTQVVRMNFIVSSTGNITLKIDPAVVLATREYVDTRIMEELYKLDNKQSVRVATTANIALAGLQVLDGVALLAGDRVLVKNQTVAKDNGIYIGAGPAWKRAEDADTNAEVTSALQVSVEQGTTQADTTWQLVTDGVIVLGTTTLTFQNITQGFAPINSPALLGTPTTPTPAQFDSSKLLVNCEFVQRAIGSLAKSESIDGGNVTLTAVHIGARIEMSSTGTLTLPNAKLLPKGSSILITTSLGAGVVNLAVQAGGVLALNNVGVVTPYSMSSGSDLLLVSDGSVWRGHASLECLRTSSLFAASLGSPGWQKLPSGLIIQWGQVVCVAGQGGQGGMGATMTLPLAYPNVHMQTVLTPSQTSTTAVSAWVDAEDAVSFRVSTNGVAGTIVRYISTGR
ncbi:phage tail protein [Pseudomonas frederiksbergensis]|uniref:Phage tail protein n=1 Tax=Pseudomonas frederiksbergensis TaxID=104087 RepID=A0A1J0EGB1_9PSED|nr:phage tail protein [Pseudomonas frederiksbergensis]APC14928.1 phage tail protein [Pseudomonas frederiksbergensis]